MTETPLSISLDSGDRISAVLTAPESPAAVRPQGIAIAHGAANDMNIPLIRFVAQGLSGRGFACLRFNFLYRELNKKSVDPEHRLVRAWQAAAARLLKETGCTGYIAMGKSLGARIASQASASGDLAPERLIFLGYPLHAPGRKDRLRDMPINRIKRPMLFFEGDRDPFCDLTLLARVFDELDPPPDLAVIRNGNHSFDLPGSDPRPVNEIYQTIVDRCVDWLIR